MTNNLKHFMEKNPNQSLNKIKLIKSLNDISFNNEFDKVNDFIKFNNSKKMIRDLNNLNDMIIVLKDENKRLSSLNEKLKEENLCLKSHIVN